MFGDGTLGNDGDLSCFWSRDVRMCVRFLENVGVMFMKYCGGIGRDRALTDSPGALTILETFSTSHQHRSSRCTDRGTNFDCEFPPDVLGKVSPRTSLSLALMYRNGVRSNCNIASRPQ